MDPELTTEVFVTNFPETTHNIQAYVMNMPTSISFESALQTVLPNIFVMIVCIFAMFPVLMILSKLLAFATEVSTSKMFKQLENGGFWTRSFRSLEMPTLDNHANSLKDTRFKIFRKK